MKSVPLEDIFLTVFQSSAYAFHMMHVKIHSSHLRYFPPEEDIGSSWIYSEIVFIEK